MQPIFRLAYFPRKTLTMVRLGSAGPTTLLDAVNNPLHYPHSQKAIKRPNVRSSVLVMLLSPARGAWLGVGTFISPSWTRAGSSIVLESQRREALRAGPRAKHRTTWLTVSSFNVHLRGPRPSGGCAVQRNHFGHVVGQCWNRTVGSYVSSCLVQQPKVRVKGRIRGQNR